VQLLHGVGDVSRGLGALRAHRGLWRWVLAPAVITLALFVALIALVLHLVDPVAGWLVAHLPGWLGSRAGGVAGTLLTTLVTVALSIGGLFVFVAVAGMIAGPFNETLSEHLEARLTGHAPAPFALGAFVRGFATGVVHGVRRLLASLIGLVLVFALGAIPVVGTIAAALIGMWLAAQNAAYDCYDAVLARRALGYRAKLAYLAHHRQRTLGLGAAVAAMMLVPGVNLVALGLGAAGATLAALEHEQRLVAQPRDRGGPRAGARPG
jgi:CysZ protein